MSFNAWSPARMTWLRSVWFILFEGLSNCSEFLHGYCLLKQLLHLGRSFPPPVMATSSQQLSYTKKLRNLKGLPLASASFVTFFAHKDLLVAVQLAQNSLAGSKWSDRQLYKQ